MRVMRVLALLLLAAWFPTAAFSQGNEEDENNLVEIKIDKEQDLKDFLDVISKSTGKPLLYDPRGQRISGVKIGAGFSHKIPKDRAFDTFRAILAFFELTLVPIGPKGYEIYLVIDSRSTNNFIKNKAQYVAYEDLYKYEDHDGLYISCAIPIKHIDNLTTLRTALNNMTSQGGVGRVHEVSGSNSIIILDFAPTVVAMAKLIAQMDVEPEGKELVMEFIELDWAFADEVADIVGELVTAQRQATTQVRRGQTAARTTTPEPRILAYEPKNALVVAATREDFEMIERLVKKFDTEGDVGSKVEVVRLNHVAAEDVADTLTQVLEGALGALQGQSTRGQQGGRRPQNPNIRQTRGSSSGFEPQVVPDSITNSLIIAADRKTLVALRDIISQLDQPKDQVLIEAAVIALTRTDDFQLGVELVGVNENGLSGNGTSGFGVTNFGLSTFEDTDGDLIPDINVPTALTQSGGGLVAGIFRNGGIPIMLQALQQLNTAKIISMPSIVTYENSSATLSSISEQPVGTQTEFSSGSVGQGFEEFVSAGVTLTVSPHISADNYLRLDIELEVSSFTGDPAGAGLPSPRQTNTIITTIALPDDHTVVMGGLIQEDNTVTESKVPLLGDIPILGYLFKNKTRRKVKRNLFIFVTPHILRQRGVSFDELHRQTYIARMKAEELIDAVDFHNSNFKYDPRFKDPDDVDIARLDISSLVDAGRFQSVPAEQALLEMQALRRRAGTAK